MYIGERSLVRINSRIFNTCSDSIGIPLFFPLSLAEWSVSKWTRTKSRTGKGCKEKKESSNFDKGTFPSSVCETTLPTGPVAQSVCLDKFFRHGIETVWHCHIHTDQETKNEQEWQGVGKLEDTEGTNDGDQLTDTWDGCTDDESAGPVDDHQNSPNNGTLVTGQLREFEVGNKETLVKHLQTDVSIERGGKHTRHKVKDVGGILQSVA
ncbi:hypothetical protein OGATHE_002060 [Ogataea polymorpha]|uniref:Uncharacterized protein n=1 Tax=Ogataea polymorpha TaxID=460523 RepID=A0A9P8PM69_9ASCO|nr:hypothetical protein OGATHE_002060 [Ogataea polymorpha]